MPFPLAAAAAAALPEAYRFLKGNSQLNKGKKLGESNIRPTYTRPTEAKTALALSESAYLNGGMPDRENLVNQISSGFANGIDIASQAASSGIDILDALTKLDYNKQQQLNQVSGQEADFRKQQLGNYQNALSTAAGYTDKEFAYNKDQPYQDQAAEASAMIGAGNANIGNAVNNAAALGTTLLMDQFGRKKNAPNFSIPTFKKLPADAGKLNLNPFGFVLVMDPTTGQLKPQQKY